MADRIEQLASRELFANRHFTLHEDRVRFPDGTEGMYTWVEKRDFALVLAVQDGGFWLVEQFRYPVGSREWEFPQGGWPQGESGTREDLAARELREETGLRAGRLRHLGHLHAAYGLLSQGYDVWVATELERGEPDREASESDMVCAWHEEAEVRAMIREGRLKDAHSVAALALYDGAGPL